MRKKLYGLLSVCYPDIHAENAGWYWWYLISRFDTTGMAGVIPSPGTLMQLGCQWLQVQVTSSWDVLMFLCERTPQAGVFWDQFVDEGTSGKSIYAINFVKYDDGKRERERNDSWWLYKSMPRAFCTAEVWCLLELVQGHGCALLYVFFLLLPRVARSRHSWICMMIYIMHILSKHGFERQSVGQAVHRQNPITAYNFVMNLSTSDLTRDSKVQLHHRTTAATSMQHVLFFPPTVFSHIDTLLETHTFLSDHFFDNLTVSCCNILGTQGIVCLFWPCGPSWTNK